MNQNANTAVLADQDILEDMIAQEKYLIDSYSSFIPEATCPQLRQVLSDNLNGCCTSQYAVFDKMSQLGWYPIKNASQQEIDEALQKSGQLKQKLG